MVGARTRQTWYCRRTKDIREQCPGAVSCIVRTAKREREKGDEDSRLR